MEKTFKENNKHKKAAMAVQISDDVKTMTNSTFRNKEGHRIMKK